MCGDKNSPLKISLFAGDFLIQADEREEVVWHRIGAIVNVQNGDFLLNGK